MLVLMPAALGFKACCACSCVHCAVMSIAFNYQLPNGLIKVRRRWGQRHPQGANKEPTLKLGFERANVIRCMSGVEL
jgi:hypothetical protein